MFCFGHGCFVRLISCNLHFTNGSVSLPTWGIKRMWRRSLLLLVEALSGRYSYFVTFLLVSVFIYKLAGVEKDLCLSMVSVFLY